MNFIQLFKRNKNNDGSYLRDIQKKRVALAKVHAILKNVDGIHSTSTQHSAFSKVNPSSWTDKKVNDSFNTLKQVIVTYKTK